MQLRPYQQRAIEDVRQKMAAGVKRICVIAATGAGKTVIAGDIIRRAEERRRRVVFLAHRKELIDQAVDKLLRFGIFAGVVMAADSREDDQFATQVCSVQTLARRVGPSERLPRADRLPPADVVIVDECHHSASESYKRVMAAWPGAIIIGLTATPWRSDKVGLKDQYDDTVVVATYEELMAEGSLVRYDPFAYDAPDLHAIPMVAGDYNQKQLGLACNTDVLIGNVVGEYLKHAAGKRAIVFAVNIDHSNSLVEQFNAAGVRAAHVDFNTPKRERAETIAAFERGEITVLSSVSIFTEGWDCLDDQTEILTADGWRGIGKVAAGDSCYSLNRQTGAMELTPVDEYLERSVGEGERMVSIRSQHANVRVTEGHEFHIKYRDPGLKGALSSRFITKTGAQLVARRSSYALPISAEASFPGVPLTDDELRLVAWFMTDGGFERSAFCISQSKEHHHEIRALLGRLGLDFTERLRQPGRGAYPNAKPCYVFSIPKGTGWQERRGWLKYAGWLDKNVAPALHEMTRAQFAVFWTELLKGDGAQQGNKAGWLWCDRKAQADAYTALAVVRGFAASYSIRDTANGHTMYLVSTRDAQWLTSDPIDKRAAKIEFETPAQGERVWCVRNRNSTLVTRRGGKIAIIGNCPAAEVCILARPTMSLTLFIQMSGRVLRPFPGKVRALIHDHGGNFMRFGMIEDPRDYSLTVTPKRQVDLHTCPVCRAIFGSIRDDGTCPKCFELIALPREEREAQARREKEQLEGERLAAEEIKRRRALAAGVASKADKVAEFLRLKELQERRGYKPNWVGFRFRALFGHWPVFSARELAGAEAAKVPFAVRVA